MKRARILLILPLCGLAGEQARGSWTMPIPRVPDRPALIWASHHGVPCPVVALKKSRPIVLVDGRREVADSNALALGVGRSYAPGSVAFANAELKCVVNGSGKGYSTFIAQLTSTSVLDDSFLVIFALDLQEYRYARDNDLPFVFITTGHELGHVAAGKPRKVACQFAPVVRKPGDTYLYSAVVFADGRQVRSTGLGDALPLFFDAVERNNYRVKLAERAKLRDAPFELFRAMPIEPPPAIAKEYGGQTFVVDLEIGPDGKVRGIQVEKSTDAQLLDYLRSMIVDWWLFLPPVRNGEPVSQNVRLPLQI